MKQNYLRPMPESRDMKATIEFYTSFSGFTLNESFEHEGAITWCDLSRDGVYLMFCLPNTHELQNHITNRQFIHQC